MFAEQQGAVFQNGKPLWHDSAHQRSTGTQPTSADGGWLSTEHYRKAITSTVRSFRVVADSASRRDFRSLIWNDGALTLARKYCSVLTRNSIVIGAPKPMVWLPSRVTPIWDFTCCRRTVSAPIWRTSYSPASRTWEWAVNWKGM